jgi:hypothetical protein
MKTILLLVLQYPLFKTFLANLRPVRRSLCTTAFRWVAFGGCLWNQTMNVIVDMKKANSFVSKDRIAPLVLLFIF